MFLIYYAECIFHILAPVLFICFRFRPSIILRLICTRTLLRHSESNVWLKAGMAARSQQVSQPAGLSAWCLMVSNTHNGGVQLYFPHARWFSEETQSGWCCTATFSSPPNPPRVSLPFFQRNGANVQPCGQLTGRPGPYANLMTAETIVSSARCRKCVVRRCTYSNPDLCWIIDDQQGQGLLLVLPCGALQGSALHVHS